MCTPPQLDSKVSKLLLHIENIAQMACAHLTAKATLDGIRICVYQQNFGMRTLERKGLVGCSPALSGWRHCSAHAAASHTLLGKTMISGWKCVRVSINGTVRVNRAGYSELPLWPWWRKWLLRKKNCRGPTSISQEVLVYFSLGVFHDLHHTLRHSLYEALGREERASEVRTCWQDHSAHPAGRERSPHSRWGQQFSNL